VSIGQRILKNTFLLTVGDKLGYLFQFVFFLYFARKFGVSPAGEYSFGFTYTYAFFILADLGISVYLVREVSRDHSSDRQLFNDCLAIRAIGIVLAFLSASAILAFFFHNLSPQKLRVIGFWGGYWVFYSLADVFITELKGHEKMGQVAALGLFLKILSTAAGIVLIHSGLDYDRVLAVLPISSFIYLCICVIYSIYYLGVFPFRLKSAAHYKTLLSELWPFFFALVLVEILYTEDILILGFIKDDSSVGIYSSAFKIVSFIFGVSPFERKAY
jgi:O-antigen/teichoic acid export membrane protein